MHSATLSSAIDPISPDRADRLAEEASYMRRVEAGILARAALAGAVRRPAGCSDAELSLLIADGESAAREFGEANLGLVWFAVNPIAKSTGVDRQELVQEGVVGLMEAIPRFDPRQGSFATFVLPRIRMRVWDAAVTRLGSLGLPPRTARRWRQVRAAEGELTQRLHRRPTAREVAAELDERVATVETMLAYEPASALPEDLVLVSPPSGVPEEPSGISSLLDRLTRLDRRIVELVHGLDGGRPLNYTETAAVLGISASTVRRRERAALLLMRAGAELLAA